MGDSNRKERLSKASEKDGKMKGGKSAIREIRRTSERQAKSKKKGSRGKKEAKLLRVRVACSMLFINFLLGIKTFASPSVFLSTVIPQPYPEVSKETAVCVCL